MDTTDLDQASRDALAQCSEQEIQFVLAYVQHGQKGRAMKAAGYSETYQQRSSLLLARPRVQAALRAVRRAVHVDVAELREIQSHLSDIVRDDMRPAAARNSAAATLLKSMAALGPDVDARTVNVSLGGASFDQLRLVSFLRRLMLSETEWSEEAGELLESAVPGLRENTHLLPG